MLLMYAARRPTGLAASALFPVAALYTAQALNSFGAISMLLALAPTASPGSMRFEKHANFFRNLDYSG
jgi:hypothetical protein